MSAMWKDRHVCVTGGAGFLGRHVVDRLIGAGVREERIYVPRRRDFDLTRSSDVERLFDTVQPDVVIHLAAEVGGIGANIERPGRLFYANMAMGLHMIEQARVHQAGKFIQVGTICAYPKLCPTPFREEDLWAGYPEESNAPYGVAKRALLTMCQAYRAQYGLNAVYLLPANLYGPHDNFDLNSSHVVAAMIRRFTEAAARGDETVTLWGDGSATRDFLYVEDAADAVVAALERYDGPEPVNVGSGRETRIDGLAGLIAGLTGFEGRIVWDRRRPNGQPRRVVDTSRAEALFGFRARTSLEEGLRRTVQWYASRQRCAAGAAR